MTITVTVRRAAFAAALTTLTTCGAVPALAQKPAQEPAAYADARQLIDDGRFAEAVAKLEAMLSDLNTVSPTRGVQEKLDAALYWKAYSLSKQGEYTDALSAIDVIQQKFGNSGWLKDANALKLELQQATGQAVSPDAQPDEELKLLALRGLMQNDPDRAVPMIEQLLAGDSSTRVKENAIFVLSQSHTDRARQIIATIARDSAHPDLQLRAIRYLGVSNDEQSRALLADVYRTATDAGVKRAVLRGLMISRSTAALNTIARSETDRSLQRDAIRNIGLIRSPEASAALKALYTADASTDVKNDVINAMFLQQDAAGLVALARAEPNVELKKAIVQKLSIMKSSEATDYLMELLK
jgi:tetratricopeptide (TPR) repeat protein